MLSGLLGEGLGVGMVCVMLELLVAERDEKFQQCGMKTPGGCLRHEKRGIYSYHFLTSDSFSHASLSCNSCTKVCSLLFALVFHNHPYIPLFLYFSLLSYSMS